MSHVQHRSRVGLLVVLATTVFTLALGYLIKLPCLTGPWDGRQYTSMCYSDLAALPLAGEKGRPPTIEADKYPAGTNYLMMLARLPASSHVSFFNWTALLWTGCALLTSWILYRLTGMRALFFAAAPTLAWFGFMNWDLPLVLLATLATAAFIGGRDGSAGVFLGLASAVKVPYPGFLVVPFAGERARRGGTPWPLILGTVGTWVFVNLPFVLLAPERWIFAYRFNAGRPADWDTLWFLLERHLGFRFPPQVINLLALLAFVGAWVLIRAVLVPRGHQVPWWKLGFPLLIAYVLTSKVFSPQWTLWLLPWFALVLPDWRLFVAFEVSNTALFVTRFQWFARTSGMGGLPFEAFEIALLLRAAVLVTCVVAWFRGVTSPAAVREAAGERADGDTG